MIKRRNSKTSQTCNLVQTDISTVINKWRDNERIKMIKKKNALVKSALVIDLDSDSDSAFESCEEPTIYIKRELAVPFSDDEDNQHTGNSTPLQSQNGNAMESNKSTPKQKIVKKTNLGETIEKIQPIASSTPLSLNCISSRSIDQTDNLNTLSESESTSSESTIIYGQEYSPKNNDNVVIKNQIIFQSPCRIPNGSGTITPIPDRSKPKKVTSHAPDKKRVAEIERQSNKKQKTQQSDNSDNKQNTRETSGDKELTKSNENLKGISKISLPDKTVSGNNSKQSQLSCSRQSNTSDSDVISKSKSSKKHQGCSNEKSNSNSKCQRSDQKDRKRSETSSKYTTDVTRRLGDSLDCSNQIPVTTAQNKSVLNNKSDVRFVQLKTTNPTSQSESSGSGEKSSPSTKGKSPLISKKQKNGTVSDENSSFKKNGETPSCSQSRNSSVKSEIDSKKPDMNRVKLISELFKTVYQNTYLKDLISTDKEKMELLLNMNLYCQYVCLSLFTRQRKWYNIFKLCKLLKLNIDDEDICDMYKIFKENKIVDTDYIQEDISKLLNLLDRNDLQDICRIYKSYPIGTTKDERINSLLKCCRQQTNLTNISTEDLIKKEIKQKMGKCVMRLNDEFHDAFYRTYVMGTFTNSLFTNLKDYFRHVNVVFPEYAVQEHIIFYTKEEFIRYARAKKCRNELEHLNDVETLKISRMAFQELKKLKDIEMQNEDRYRDVPHLIQFTARYVYVSILSTAIKTLATKYPDDAQQWLEYMISHESNLTHRIGEWYYHLTWLYMRYTEPRDYERAATHLVHVLKKYKAHLSDVQLHQLEERGRQLKHAVKYKISQWHYDTIAELVPRSIHLEELPQTVIDAHTVRGNERGQRRNYIIHDKEGTKLFVKVEEIALQHYFTNGYTGGNHCEGSLIKATFTLFFWDIIYMDMPANFVSKNQSKPLDMYTKYFYTRRKDQIDERLKQIESEWSYGDVVEWLYRNYENHSHKMGFCVPDVSTFIKERELLKILVDCVGRRILAKIYERFVKNIRHYTSGMPDLLVWNVNTEKSKFVEVKGENDRLSIGQKLWIKYLQEIGADVEVCHVHSIGSKRKKIVKKAKISEPRATSSSSE